MNISRFPLLITFFLILISSSFALHLSIDDADKGPSNDSVRKEIDAMYEEWGAARVSLDREKMEKILAPEFYALLNGRKIPRDEFVQRVSEKRQGSTLTRFDAKVLTVQRTKDSFTVVITEKIEFEITGPDKKPLKVYSFWVTRDNCRKEDEKWIVTSSEAIGYENWKPGTAPPIQDW